MSKKKDKGNTEISRILNVNKSTVDRIRSGEQWKEISSKYKIPESIVIQHRKITPEIIKLFNNGIKRRSKIFNILGLPDTPANRRYFSNIKNMNYTLKVESSTTIPQG
jgi:hypothetical protein